ncbi:MAG: SMC-Scp complex subunit ScpB [Bacillota bacterium]
MKIDTPVLIEAVLFAADEPVPLNALAEGLELGELEVSAAIATLEKTYKGRGIVLQRVAGGFMIRTRPECWFAVERVLSKRVPVALSKGALETLAVIAYHQPVTRQDIEAVRGVNPESSIETLLEKGLIKEAGRKKTLGRPKLYVTTDEFMKKASLNSLSDLPPIAPPRRGMSNTPKGQELPMDDDRRG